MGVCESRSKTSERYLNRERLTGILLQALKRTIHAVAEEYVSRMKCFPQITHHKIILGYMYVCYVNQDEHAARNFHIYHYMGSSFLEFALFYFGLHGTEC